MLPHTGSWTLNEFIPIAGQATADNLPPGIGQIQYAMRAPTLAMCEAVFAVLDRNADHIAAMTHCTVEQGVGHPHPRRPAEPRDGRDHLPQFRAPRRAAMVGGGEALRPRDADLARPRADGRALLPTS